MENMTPLSLLFFIIFFGNASAGGYGSYGGASASSSASASASSFSTGNSGSYGPNSGLSGNPFLSKAAKVDNSDDKSGQLLYSHPHVNLDGVKDGIDDIKDGIVGVIGGVLDGVHKIHGNVHGGGISDCKTENCQNYRGTPVRPNIFLGPGPYGSNSGGVGVGYGGSFAGASAGANAFAGGFGARHPGKKNCGGPGCNNGRRNKPLYPSPGYKPSCNGISCRDNNDNSMNPLEPGTSYHSPVYPPRPITPTYPKRPVYPSAPQQPTCSGPNCRGSKNNRNPSGYQPTNNNDNNMNPLEPGTSYHSPVYPPRPITPTYPKRPVYPSTPQQPSCSGPNCRGSKNNRNPSGYQPPCNGPSCRGHNNNNPLEPGTNYLPPTNSPKHKTPNDEPWQPVINPQGSSQGGPVNWHPVINPSPACNGPSCDGEKNPSAGHVHERPVFLSPNDNSKRNPNTECTGYNCQGKNIPSSGNPYSSTGCPGPYCEGPEYTKPTCSGPDCARRNQPKPVCTGPTCQGNQYSTTGCPGPYCDGPEYSKPKCSGSNCGARQNPNVGCSGANCQGNSSPHSSYPVCPGPDCNGIIQAIPQKPAPQRPAGCTSGNCQPRESNLPPVDTDRFVWPSFQKPNLGHTKEIQQNGGNFPSNVQGNSGCPTGTCTENQGVGGDAFSSASASSSSFANAGTGSGHGPIGPGSGTGSYGGSFSSSFASASASSSASAHSGGYGR